MQIIPKGETVVVSYLDTHGIKRFLMTHKQSTGYFFLYELRYHSDLNNNDEKEMKHQEVIKLGKAKTPTELEEKYQTAKICAK